LLVFSALIEPIAGKENKDNEANKECRAQAGRHDRSKDGGSFVSTLFTKKTV
jgi:hypothetical protein